MGAAHQRLQLAGPNHRVELTAFGLVQAQLRDPNGNAENIGYSTDDERWIGDSAAGDDAKHPRSGLRRNRKPPPLPALEQSAASSSRAASGQRLAWERCYRVSATLRFCPRDVEDALDHTLRCYRHSPSLPRSSQKHE